MTCQQLVDFLVDYLDGNLPQDVRTGFESHLQCCPPCVAFLRTYNTGSELAKAACSDQFCEVPEELIQAIVAARKLPN